MRHGPSKTGYYVLEGLNSFATAYFFNYVLQRLKRELGFSDLETLLLCAFHGLIYIPASIYGGRFGQRFGYFRSLHVGFSGQLAGVVLAGLVPAVWAQVAGVAIWTASMSFVWPMLEALVSEHEPRERLSNRVGLYNVVWAATAAVGVFAGGTLYKVLGAASLYWLPALVHGLQWLALPGLQRRHDVWVIAGNDPVPVVGIAEGKADGISSPAIGIESGPAYFKRLGWIGNPFNYMAINTVLAIVPSLSVRLGLGVDRMGWLMSVWFVARALSFFILWHWRGWHYRFGWFAGGLLLLLAGFVGVVLAPSLGVLILSQVALGWASAVLYSSSLLYSMDGSETKGEHGGIHEAFIGCGIFAGPAVSALAVWATGSDTSPAWAVGIFLFAGFGAALVVKGRSKQP